MTENIVQAVARIVIGDQMISINERYRPALTVHDAIICLAPEHEKEEAMNFVLDVMVNHLSGQQGYRLHVKVPMQITMGIANAPL